MESEQQDVLSVLELPGLHTRAFGRTAFYIPEVDSTNLFLKSRAERFPFGTLLSAGEQTAGRGRLGRTWTGNGKDAPFSLLLQADAPQPALSLCCGLAVAKGLSDLTGENVGIKWPNDIICGNKKICGILCECRPSDTSGVYMICGMGVNLTQTAEDFQRAGLPHGGSLGMFTYRPPDAKAVIAAVLNAFEPLYDIVERKGFPGIKEEFEGRCVTLGKQVRVLEGGESLTGTAVGIDDDGCLLVNFGDKSGRPRPVLAGEASVRGLLGYI